MMRKRRAGSVAAFVLLALAGCTESERASPISLADAQLLDLNGNQVALLDGSPKVRIINFWATWCAPCREEMPDLQSLDDMLDDERYQVIGVTVDRDLNLVREFMLKYGIRFQQFSDPAMGLASGALDIRAYPETLLVDGQGRVIKRVVGSRPWADPDFIEAFLEPVNNRD